MPDHRAANKALVLKFYQYLNDSNWVAIAPLIHPEYQHHYVSDTGFAAVPWSRFEAGYRSSFKAFPDWKLVPRTVVAEGDYVSVLLSASGTHRGAFAGIAASGTAARAPIMLLHEVREGKLVADWELMNPNAFLKQLKKE